MTTTGYLILISGLCVLAGFMVYTRLSLRAKRRGAIKAGAATSVTDGQVPPALDDSRNESGEEELASSEVEESIEARPVTSRDSEPVDEYYDDLQKAAEGLAELMRSSAKERVPEILSEKSASPATRFQEHHDLPVRETEEEEMASLDHCVTDVEEEAIIEEQEKPDLPEVSAREWLEAAETTVESVVATEEESLLEEEEIPEPVLPIVPRTHRQIVVEALGAEVHDRIEAIDSGLDQLEELVRSIESSLASLSGPSDEEEILPAIVEAA